jgi:hypothetical protein
VTIVPSPKSIWVDWMVPPEQVEPEVEAVTVTGAIPLAGVTASFATGGWLTVPATV